MFKYFNFSLSVFLGFFTFLSFWVMRDGGDELALILTVPASLITMLIMLVLAWISRHEKARNGLIVSLAGILLGGLFVLFIGIYSWQRDISPVKLSASSDDVDLYLREDGTFKICYHRVLSTTEIYGKYQQIADTFLLNKPVPLGQSVMSPHLHRTGTMLRFGWQTHAAFTVGDTLMYVRIDRLPPNR